VAIFRDPLVLVLVDEDNHELRRITAPGAVPRVGENVRIAGTPYVVERVGYDVPLDEVTSVWVVCRPT
jgi:hypothetical protein